MVGDEAYAGTATDTGIKFDRQDIDRAHARVFNLFLTLVREGYIDADVKGSYKGGPPFSFAIVRGLSKRGLRAIQEMPDPNDQIIQRLDAIAQAINALQNIPEEKKKSAINATDELKHFARGLPPGLTIELGKAMFGG